VEAVLKEPDTDAVLAGRLFRGRRCPFIRSSALSGAETRSPLGVAAPFRLLPRAPKHRSEVEWLPNGTISDLLEARRFTFLGQPNGSKEIFLLICFVLN
jgi:hypothetical protein